MNASFRPFWGFLVVFVASALGALAMGPGESFLAGMVFSGFSMLRFRQPVPIRRLFPVFLLFVFLLGLAVVPSRALTPTLAYTTECLLALRILLMVLLEIQERRTPAGLGSGLLCLGLVAETVLSGGLAFSTFPVASGPWSAGFAQGHFRILIAVTLVVMLLEFFERRRNPA